MALGPAARRRAAPTGPRPLEALIPTRRVAGAPAAAIRDGGAAAAGRSRPLGLLRLAAVWGLVAALLALGRPGRALWLAGLPLLGLGCALRLWAAGHLVKNQRLATSGPYRLTRNPLYLGRLLLFTGLCVMAALPRGANWLVLAGGWCVFFGFYLPRKERVEPARLRAVHGAAYDRYAAAVPALWPRWRALAGPDERRWSARLALHNREHWMLLGVLAASVWLYRRI